jgi:hypothetical protein
MMKILACDQSSTHVGYCIADGGDYILSGVFSPPGSADARVKAISRWARDKVERYEITHVILEEPSGDHGNRKTDRLLARVYGVIEAHALAYGAQVARVFPMQVRATGCHKHALLVAATIAGKPCVGEDEADAIGVWLAGWAQIRSTALEGIAQ